MKLSVLLFLQEREGIWDDYVNQGYKIGSFSGRIIDRTYQDHEVMKLLVGAELESYLHDRRQD